MQLDVHRGALGVPPGIGERLLHDAVGGELDAWVEGGHVSADDEADTRPRGVPCLVEQLVELLPAGLGLPVPSTRPRPPPHHPTNPPHPPHPPPRRAPPPPP